MEIVSMFRQYFSSLVIYDALSWKHELSGKVRKWDLLNNHNSVLT